VSVYVIAQLKFTNKPLYDRYKARFPEVFGKHAGVLLVADEHPVVLEGDWPRDKIVIMSFADQAAADAFRASKEYQEISIDRKAGADAVVIVARGVR
jgi:uncharacterized protein (DUF1330 family)